MPYIITSTSIATVVFVFWHLMLASLGIEAESEAISLEVWHLDSHVCICSAVIRLVQH